MQLTLSQRENDNYGIDGFTKQEIQSVLKDMNNNRTPGSEDIHVELIETAP